MLDRRVFLLGAGAALVSAGSSLAGEISARKRKKLAPKQVAFDGYATGTIVVEPRRRRLYFVEKGGVATRYIVGVGVFGTKLKGRAVVGRKAKWPRWQPTDKMIRLRPRRYAPYKNGMPGGPDNPLGARALYIYQDGKDTYYRIHGTNNPSSIGRAMSMGCIRMLNEHVEELYARVRVGTPVVIR
jgi:lipoprotein-anchoring transpeptidase ErfK/SrfK